MTGEFTWKMVRLYDGPGEGARWYKGGGAQPDTEKDGINTEDTEKRRTRRRKRNGEHGEEKESMMGQVAGTPWDANQYLKFSDHRLRPGLELLERIPLESPAVIYDLGCGTGNLTRIIAERWPAATVYGLDNSKEMLAKAAGESAKVRWVEGDVKDWRPDEPPDLIYSNATLHWVENHAELFPRLAGFLKPGGCLAVQMPLSWNLPSHWLMRETLVNGGPQGSPLGAETLREAVGREWVEPAQVYYDLLAGGATRVDIWETRYLQILEGQDAVLEWVKGTGLRPILNGLQGEERRLFLAEYSRRLREAYPMRADGKTVYPFRRLFMVVMV
jgi:trans-aconitate 2-methyltransferase